MLPQESLNHSLFNLGAPAPLRRLVKIGVEIAQMGAGY
jgi:hypothetical protein